MKSYSFGSMYHFCQREKRYVPFVVDEKEIGSGLGGSPGYYTHSNTRTVSPLTSVDKIVAA